MGLREALEEKGIDWEELNSVIDLSDLDEKSVRQLVGRVKEKLEGVANALEGVLQPENSLAHMHECGYFKEKDLEELQSAFKKLMFLHREALLQELRYEEDACLEFVKTFLKEWGGVENSLKRFFKMMRDSWKEGEEFEPRLEYLG